MNKGESDPERGNVGSEEWAGDISERRRVELALARVTDMLERTSALAKVGGWELDLRSMDLFWSLEACRIHDVDPPVAPPLERAMEFYADEARSILRAAVQRATEDGTPWDLELPLTTATGRQIWVRTHGTPVIEEGRPVKLAGAVHEITDRKRAQEALVASEAALRGANESLRRSNDDLDRRIVERTAQLRALTVELARAEDRVRLRTADSLHESLAQLLSVAVMKLDTLQSEVPGEDGQAKLRELRYCVSGAIDVCRTLTHELSPPILHTLGLGPGLQWLATWHHNRNGLIVNVDASRNVSVEDAELRLTLFRAASELLFNVFKHSGTRDARLRLHQSSGGIVSLEVSDDGVGFDISEEREREGSTGRFGLFSLRERIEALGGNLEIRSAPACGTRVSITVPIPEESLPGSTTGLL
jgi:signal transduction histidine kinase